jgi:hypothetical protein
MTPEARFAMAVIAGRQADLSETANAGMKLE